MEIMYYVSNIAISNDIEWPILALNFFFVSYEMIATFRSHGIRYGSG